MPVCQEKAIQDVALIGRAALASVASARSPLLSCRGIAASDPEGEP